MMISSSGLLRFGNIGAFVLMVTINGLAGSTTIIGGRNTAEVSGAYPTLITPAGYTFAIWGIIYVLLGLFVFFQALPNERNKDFLKKVGWLFVLSSLLNILWLFLWQSEFLGWSVVAMFLLLASLVGIYLRLNIGKSAVSLWEKIAVHLPFSVYLGWITIASIANVAAALVSVNWNGFGIVPEVWASLVLIVALVITLLVLIARRDVAYGLVIAWALIGIVLNQDGSQNVHLVAEINVVIVAIALAVSLILRRIHRQ